MLLAEANPEAPGKMKQFASWFTHGVAGGAALRKSIYEAKSGESILTAVQSFFESRLSTDPAAPASTAPALMSSGDFVLEN